MITSEFASIPSQAFGFGREYQFLQAKKAAFNDVNNDHRTGSLLLNLRLAVIRMRSTAAICGAGTFE